MALHQDFRDLLGEFAAAGVRYLVVGGYAVGFHAQPRFTKDMDLWIAGDAENVARVYRALEAFGAPPQVLDALESLSDTEILYMGTPPVRVDILKSLPGAEFEGAYRTRRDADWNGVPVSVIGIDQLIETKRASGRPQDLVDAGALERAARLATTEASE